MHIALERTARSTTKLLPCLCSGNTDGREHIGNVLSGVDSIGGSSTGNPNSRRCVIKGLGTVFCLERILILHLQF